MSQSIISSEKLMVGLGSQYAYQSVIAPHTHNQAQLLYASEGIIRVYTPDNVWVIPPQYALWIPANIEHRVVSLSNVCLSTVLVEKKAANLLGQTCFIVRVSHLLRELILRLNQPNRLDLNKNERDEAIEKSLQILIFDEIKHAFTVPMTIPWPKDARLIRICEELMQHPNSYKNLTFWADQIGTSSRTLIRLFQKETGLNYRAWIQQMHIALALGKLSRGESISQIASSLGYCSSSAFSAMFKKHLNESPQYFRK